MEERVREEPSDVALRAALARVRAELGDRAGAREILRELTADGLAALPRRYIWLTCVASLADACVLLGNRAIARELYRQAVPFENQCAVSINVAFLGSMHRPLGGLAALLGRKEAARRHFELALAIHERVGARLLIERTRLQRDRWLDLA